MKTNARAGISHHTLVIVQNTYVFPYIVYREACQVPPMEEVQ